MKSNLVIVALLLSALLLGCTDYTESREKFCLDTYNMTYRESYNIDSGTLVIVCANDTNTLTVTKEKKSDGTGSFILGVVLGSMLGGD